MEKIVPAFEKSNDLACDLIIGSSGKIAAQIEQGAPFDIFLSADNKYPTSIYESDLAIGPPEIYAFGKLVLWTLERDSHLDTDFLLSGKTQYISIANPITAPYGLAAESFLKASGIYLDIQDKLVFGESIAQTNQFLLSGAANAALTSLSTVMSPNLKDRGTWILLDSTLYDPIVQSCIILKNKKNVDKGASAFRDFLLSKEGQEILHNFGYSTPK
jgi:molybdate transport system substrate-binding protein